MSKCVTRNNNHRLIQRVNSTNQIVDYLREVPENAHIT
jgi:hypothetical protein